MKRMFIVTGGNGFLGNNIVRELLKNKENEVRVLVLKDDSVTSLKGLDCKIFYGDVTKEETLKDIFCKNDDDKIVVIHCAAIVYIKDKPNPQVYNVNVNGTKNIIKKVLETNGRLIYVNTVHSIPEPMDDIEITEIKSFNADNVKGIYAKSKAEAGQLILNCVNKNGLNATIIQPSGIIGPGDYGMTHMTRLILGLIRGKIPAIVDGGYDFVDVRDVTKGIISAIDNGKAGECYILSNKYVKIKEIAEIVNKYCNNKKRIIILPMVIAKISVPLLALYYNIKKEVPLYTNYSLYTLNAKAKFSHEKADKELYYNTRKLNETIIDTIEWLEKQVNEV